MARLRDLVKEIKKHRDLYYNKEAEISDGEYDKKEEELKEKIMEAMKVPDSYLNSEIKEAEKVLNEVGKDKADGFPKKEHIIYMNSLDKVNSPEDFLKWSKKHPAKEYCVQYKLDGISIELQYENGKFVAGVTRGDGKEGDNISNNVRKMKGFVNILQDKIFTGGIRGEIVLFKNIFKEKYEPQGYKNPRNMASGISKQKHGERCEDLSIICYDILNADSENNFKTEYQKIGWLLISDFNVVETEFFKTSEEVLKHWNHTGNLREGFEYDMDGLVIKNNKIDLEDQKRSRPEKQIAFKFNTEEVTTELIGIEWSRHGHNYTPVALLEPVELMGTTVKRASLANPDEIKRLGIDLGDKVAITKRGEIIPHVERVVEKSETAIEPFPPKTCFVCKTELINEGTRLYCPNDDCEGRAYKRIEKWVRKLGAKGFGPKLLQHLYDSNLVTKISDFYEVNMRDVLESTNLKKATKKAFDNLYAIKKIPLATFIAGLDIEGVGERVIQFAVDAGHNSLVDYEFATQRLMNVNGIGPDRAEKIERGIEYMWGEIKAIAFHVEIEYEVKKEEKLMAKLDGKSFCFTGKLNFITRSEAEVAVVARGGQFRKSVVKGLDYLVTNTPDSGTAKNTKAQELGTKIITEAEFLKIAEM